MKYINVFETEEAYNASAGTLEKPLLSFVKTGKIFSLSVGGGSLEGPAANEIWYTTTDGLIYDVSTIMDTYISVLQIPTTSINHIVNNEYKNGKGVLTCKNDINVTGIDVNTMLIGPTFGNIFGLTSVTLCSITLPNDITNIGTWSFYGCINLTSIDIPSKVTTILGSAFEDCLKIENIIIPNAVSTFGELTFCNCDSITSINIPDLITELPKGLFADCNKLSNIIIPNSVITIGDTVFADCKKLSNITIPNSVTLIGDSVFANSNIVTCIIGNSVTNIGNYIFSSCNNLTSVTLQSAIPPIIGEDIFLDKTTEYIIYVPVLSVNAYKVAEGWSEYADKIQAIP